MEGTTFRVFLNGALVNSASGLTQLTTGNVGFGKNVTPTSAVPPGVVWIDDVVVRRYAFPEPTAGTEPSRLRHRIGTGAATLVTGAFAGRYFDRAPFARSSTG